MRASTVTLLALRAVACRSLPISFSDTGNPICNVCGEGFALKDLDAVIEFPSQPDLTCRDFEIAALSGFINPTGCILLDDTVISACGCREIEVTFPFCSICGNGSDIIVREDIDIFLEDFPTLSCSELTVFGSNGFIDPTTCEEAFSIAPSQCGCAKLPNVHPACSVCGAGFQIEDAEAIISFPGYRPQTCQEFSDAGLQGLLDPIVCPAVSTRVQAACGCKEIVPSQLEHPLCSVCGNGYEVVNLNAMVYFPDQTSVTCREWQSAGNNGEISTGDCFGFLGATAAACGCKMSESISEPKLCFVCGDEDASIVDGGRVILIPNQPAISCNDFAQAGVDRRIAEDMCPHIVDIVKSECVCSERATPSPIPLPLSCPEIALGGCSICGEGGCATSPNSIITLPNGGLILCGVLEDAARLGLLPSGQCPYIVSIASDICGCEPVGAHETGVPTSPPVAASAAPVHTIHPTPTEPTSPPIPPIFEHIFKSSPPVEPTVFPTLEPSTSSPSTNPSSFPPFEAPTLIPSEPPSFMAVPPVTEEPTLFPVVFLQTPPPSEPLPPTASPTVFPTTSPTSTPVLPQILPLTLLPTPAPTPAPTLLNLTLPPIVLPTPFLVKPPTLYPTLVPTTKSSKAPVLKIANEVDDGKDNSPTDKEPSEASKTTKESGIQKTAALDTTADSDAQDKKGDNGKTSDSDKGKEKDTKKKDTSGKGKNTKGGKGKKRAR